MFGKWFGGNSRQAQRGEDQVWMSGAARQAGMCRSVEELTRQGNSVIVVCLSVAAGDVMTVALGALQPVQCRDVFGRESLRTQLVKPGGLTIALSAALPAALDVAGSDGVPVHLLVLGRNPTRDADEAINRFADLLGTRATIAFHLSLDDELLQKFANDGLKPLLEKLGMSEHEAIAHSMVTRAIKNAQGKQA